MGWSIRRVTLRHSALCWLCRRHYNSHTTPQMRVRFHAPVSRIVSHRVHARNAINETNKHSRKYTAVYCWTQANFRSRATCQYYNGVHAAYTIPLFHSKLLLLMLAAFIGKRLYVGLVSVRLSVRLSVPLVYNWLHHLYRLYIHLYSPFRWKQKTYTRTYDRKNWKETQSIDIWISAILAAASIK